MHWAVLHTDRESVKFTRNGAYPFLLLQSRSSVEKFEFSLTVFITVMLRVVTACSTSKPGFSVPFKLFALRNSCVANDFGAFGETLL